MIITTQPLGDILTEALKGHVQGGRINAYRGRLVIPSFKCCISGNSVGVPKPPVPNAGVSPLRSFTGYNITVNFSHAYSPTGTDLISWSIDWGDGSIGSSGNFPVNSAVWSYADPGFFRISLCIVDDDGRKGCEEFEVEIVSWVTLQKDVLFVIEGSSVCRSLDGGIVWERVLNPGPGDMWCIKADPFTASQNNKQLIVACGDRGLYKTYNTGYTWYNVPFLRTAYAVAYDKVVRDKIYVMCIESGTDLVYISRSVDGGRTWTHHNTGMVAASTSYNAMHSALATSYTGEYVYFSFTVGSTQTGYVVRIREDLTDQTTIATWATGSPVIQAPIIVSSDDWIYIPHLVTMAFYGLAGSDDFGDTWQQCGSSDWMAAGYESVVTATCDVVSPTRLNALVYDPAWAPIRVYRMFMTDDRGTSWRQVLLTDEPIKLFRKSPNDIDTTYIGYLTGGTVGVFNFSVWNGHVPLPLHGSGFLNQNISDIVVL